MTTKPKSSTTKKSPKKGPKKSPSKVKVHELNPLQVGKTVIIRGIVHYYVGKITHIKEKSLRLFPCANVRDSGRWHDALVKGFGEDSEVWPKAGAEEIKLADIVDMTEWDHQFPYHKKDDESEAPEKDESETPQQHDYEDYEYAGEDDDD